MVNENNENVEEVVEEKVDSKKVYEEGLKNIKAEFNRKLENLASTQQELINAITGLYVKNNGSPKEEDSDIDTLIISDPKKAVNRIKSEAKNEIMKEIQDQNKLSQEQQAVISNIINDFPELSDPNHELTVKTIEIFGRMSEREKALPLSYKVAAREAADELNILPKKKRNSNSDNDSFTLNAKKGNYNKDKNNKVEDSTLAFAEAMGLDINNKDLVERLAKHAKRNFKSWA